VLFKSPIFAQASGSIAGTVFSRNAGGMYVRSRANPTNPNTDAQQAVRDAMRILVFNWSNLLTDEQRESWNTYAFNTPTLNKLGESTHKTGQQMYIRGNIPRLQAGEEPSSAGPTTFDLGTLTPGAAPSATAGSGMITVPYASADPWVNEEGSVLLIYQSRPQNPTRNFGKGPFQLAKKVIGDSTTPPTSPTVFASLFPMEAGQKIFLQIRASYVNGRLTGKLNPTLIVS
jgi:hypothetical protein